MVDEVNEANGINKIDMEQLTSIFLAVEITAFVAIVVMCLLIYSLRKNTLMLQYLQQQADNHDAQIAEEYFNGEQAEKWFEKGDLQALNRYCEGFIKDSPNSVHANWYYALSHYNCGDYETARKYFEQVIRINPLWRDGAVIYLQEIANKAGFSDSRTVH